MPSAERNSCCCNSRSIARPSAKPVSIPEITLRILDRAIQVHGGGGVSDDFPLAMMWAYLRTLRLADGPDEVHKMSLARRELAQQREKRGA